MLNILFNIFIFPISQVIELCFVFVFRIFQSPGVSIIGLSMAVSTFVLPIYLMADRQQQAEREKQQQMKRMKDNINAVFKGDKRFMILSTLYRQHNYHPIYAVRSNYNILIQIPFFIAAFHFLSNLEILSGQEFLFIKDLGAPDGFLNKINLLPFLMTGINIASGAIYTREMGIRDKIQVYGVAIIFLILLYNSPAALVLYWTCNNIYSLVKNILLKTKYSKKIIYFIVFMIMVNIIIYALAFHQGSLSIRISVAFIAILILLTPLWKQIKNVTKINVSLKNTALEYTDRTFILSAAALFLLIGLVVPSGLVASDVKEFSFLGRFSSPLPYIGITLVQSFGFLFWILCLYFLLSKHIKTVLTVFATAALGIFLLNAFVLTGSYGFMAPDLHFEEFTPVTNNKKMISFIAVQLVCVLALKLLILKNKKVLLSLQAAIIAVLLWFGIGNCYKIIQTGLEITKYGISKQYTFSSSGKNVLLIVLDRATSGFVPYIFEEKPELYSSFDGFVFYPNTIGYGPYTQHGMPSIFGGYNYNPLEMQKRRHTESWDERYKEAMQVLPRIFAESNFKVTVYNQSFMDNELYDKYENITAGRDIGAYTDAYISSFENAIRKDHHKILSGNLIRFSFFKASPLFLHEIIYDNGNYLSVMDSSTMVSSPSSDITLNLRRYTKRTIDHYTALYFLPDVTSITGRDENNVIMFINMLAHERGFFELPDYRMTGNVPTRGDGPLANYGFYHTNMASFLLLAKWFDYLKKNDVYDNTRIIIVSDHGVHFSSYEPLPIPYNFRLPDSDRIYLQSYRSLLMVKDFNEKNRLRTDDKFMTTADIPTIATENLIQNPINPFTGIPIVKDKENGIILTTSGKSLAELTRLGPSRNDWYHVRENIFDPDNWSRVEFDF